jgi:hypothetical protein
MLRHRRARRSAQPLGGMRKRISILGALMISLLGCAVTELDGSETPPSRDQAYQTVCSVFSSKGADEENSRVTVKARLVLHEHGAMLRDSACRGKTIFLRYQEGGPYFETCESDRLSHEIGCPPVMNGPIVTISGVLSRRGSSKYGELTVERILEYASTRTGERVEP